MADGAMQPSWIPWRHAPFEAHAASFRVGLQPIPLQAWFEGGEADPAARKDALFAAAGERVWRETPGSRPAQAEALELVCKWLGAAVETGDEPPLRVAARLVSDDLCLMERRDGGWTLTAASLCAGTFFTAADAVGQALEGLHAPVTAFAGLAGRVARIFDGLQPDTLLERRNWTVVNSPELHLPAPAPMHGRVSEIAPEDAAEALFIRIERQTVRKLPVSGAVLFTIRVWRHALGELERDPPRLAAFARAWGELMGEGGRDFRAYKRLDLYDPLVRGFLAARGF
jgi:hypothetical protein